MRRPLLLLFFGGSVVVIVLVWFCPGRKEGRKRKKKERQTLKISVLQNTKIHFQVKFKNRSLQTVQSACPLLSKCWEL